MKVPLSVHNKLKPLEVKAAKSEKDAAKAREQAISVCRKKLGEAILDPAQRAAALTLFDRAIDIVLRKPPPVR